MAVLPERAQAAGATRTDVAIDELFALIGSACQASNTLKGREVSPRRLGRVILDGLRPPAPR